MWRNSAAVPRRATTVEGRGLRLCCSITLTTPQRMRVPPFLLLPPRLESVRKMPLCRPITVPAVLEPSPDPPTPTAVAIIAKWRSTATTTTTTTIILTTRPFPVCISGSGNNLSMHRLVGTVPPVIIVVVLPRWILKIRRGPPPPLTCPRRRRRPLRGTTLIIPIRMLPILQEVVAVRSYHHSPDWEERMPSRRDERRRHRLRRHLPRRKPPRTIQRLLPNRPDNNGLSMYSYYRSTDGTTHTQIGLFILKHMINDIKTIFLCRNRQPSIIYS